MNYIELNLDLFPLEDDTRDIAIAHLDGLPFETFVESEGGIIAYIKEPLFDEKILKKMLESLSNIGVQFHSHWKLIPDENWNENWEKNFEPIVVDDKCLIRATFHQDLPQYPIEVIINPKMSFGTGHHQTTYMMVKHILSINCSGLTVFDIGCGTGILSILSCKLGASQVIAVDIDEWAVNNCQENVTINNCNSIETFMGGVELLSSKKCDILLANINRNVLLNDIEKYADLLNGSGRMFLSGFYNEDAPILIDYAENCGFLLQEMEIKDNWVILDFQR